MSKLPETNIGFFKVTNVSTGGSINFGHSIHKGNQANVKFSAGEFIIGDEINFGNGEEEEEEVSANEKSHEKKV